MERRQTWLAILLVVAASRLLFVPGQPWEQDEALFAAAAFDTDLAQSRPHAPGFPLWVAVGKLGWLLLGDPLLALQLTSALASVASVALLARLWGVALESVLLGRLAALLFAFLPGVWFHAPRAFTTTPALALALAAGVVWLRPGRAALVVGSALLAAAVLVRPPLLPLLAAAAIFAALLRRERVAGLALAGVAGVGVLVIGFLPVVVDCGGIAGFVAVTVHHGSGHGGALHLASWTPAGLGVVKALGGLPTTWVALLLAGVGCRRWWRQRPRLAGFWVAMTASTAAWFLLAHNRTYPRYTLPLLALLVGPAVGGLDALLRSRLRTILVTSGATLVGAAWTLPATIAMTTTPFPPLRALAAANAAGPARGVVVDGGLSPFGDLLTLARRGQRPWCWRPLLAEGRVPLSMLTGPWLYVADEGTPSAFVPAPLQQRQRFACDEPRLHTLSQDRYLSCWVTGDGAIVLDPEWPQQNDQGGVLLGDEVRLLLQPTPLGSSFGAVLDVQGSAQLELDGGVQGRRSGVLGSGYHRGSHRVYAPLHRSGAAARLPTEVTLRRGGASSGTVVLERAWVDDPFGSHAPRQLNSSEQADGLDGLLDSDGFYSLERFGDADGRWAGERAWLSLPVGQGELTLRLLAPRPIPAQVTVAIESPPWQRHVEVGPQWTEVTLPIAVPQGRVKVILRVSNPFVPSRVIENSTDSRQLGVVLGSVSFEPAAR